MPKEMIGGRSSFRTQLSEVGTGFGLASIELTIFDPKVPVPITVDPRIETPIYPHGPIHRTAMSLP